MNKKRCAEGIFAYAEIFSIQPEFLIFSYSVHRRSIRSPKRGLEMSLCVFISNRSSQGIPGTKYCYQNYYFLITEMLILLSRCKKACQ